MTEKTSAMVKRMRWRTGNMQLGQYFVGNWLAALFDTPASPAKDRAQKSRPAFYYRASDVRERGLTGLPPRRTSTFSRTSLGTT